MVHTFYFSTSDDYRMIRSDDYMQKKIQKHNSWWAGILQDGAVRTQIFGMCTQEETYLQHTCN